MADKAQNGSWITARGDEVPERFVKPVDKKRDALVEKYFKRIIDLESKLREVKVELIKDVEKYLAYLADSAGGKDVEWKGNLQLTNFTGNRQIEMDVNEVIEFDERLQLAKAKIDECLKRWSKGGNDKIGIVISEAFNIDKKGKVNSKMIWRLRNLDMHDQEWKAAMDLIAESVKVAGSRRYFNFRRRLSQDTPWSTINMNFSTL